MINTMHIHITKRLSWLNTIEQIEKTDYVKRAIKLPSEMNITFCFVILNILKFVIYILGIFHDPQ
jgi:hypothetical protein